MWITTKSIVKEIKKNQEDLVNRIVVITDEQKNYSKDIKDQLDSLSERVNLLEKNSLKMSEKGNNILTGLMMFLEEINNNISGFQSDITQIISEQAQSCCHQISSLYGEREIIFEHINHSVDQVCVNIKKATEQCENDLRKEIVLVKDIAVAEHEKEISLVIKNIIDSSRDVKAIVNGVKEEAVCEIQKCNTGIVDLNGKTETIHECINHSVVRVSENIKNTTEQCEHNLREEIQHAKDRNTVERSEKAAEILNNLDNKTSQIEKILHESSREIVNVTRNNSNDISEEIKAMNISVHDISSMIEQHDTAMSSNIVVMNAAIQETMRNLMALDEGNRLIIAKLLLKDMEI